MEHTETTKEQKRRYRLSDKGRAAEERYQKSPKGVASRQRTTKKYEASRIRTRTPEQRESMSVYYKNRRDRQRAMLDRIKVESGCLDCGYDERPEALDFDHVRGEKKYSVGRMPGRSDKAIFAEVEKCVVRCANCHRIKTSEERVPIL